MVTMSQKELQRVKVIENAAGTLRAYRGDHLLMTLPLPLQEYGDRNPAPLRNRAATKNPDAPHLQPRRPPRF